MANNDISQYYKIVGGLDLTSDTQLTTLSGGTKLEYKPTRDKYIKNANYSNVFDKTNSDTVSKITNADEDGICRYFGTDGKQLGTFGVGRRDIDTSGLISTIEDADSNGSCVCKNSKGEQVDTFKCHVPVENKKTQIDYGVQKTLATVDGVDITVTVPNPSASHYLTYNPKEGNGYYTKLEYHQDGDLIVPGAGSTAQLTITDGDGWYLITRSTNGEVIMGKDLISNNDKSSWDSLINWDAMASACNCSLSDLKNISNINWGTWGYGGDRTGTYPDGTSFNKGDIILKHPVSDYDELVVVYCADEGQSVNTYVWKTEIFIEMMSGARRIINLINQDYWEWYVNTINHPTRPSTPLDTENPRLYCNAQDCGIVEIYGVKYAGKITDGNTALSAFNTRLTEIENQIASGNIGSSSTVSGISMPLVITGASTTGEVGDIITTADIKTCIPGGSSSSDVAYPALNFYPPAKWKVLKKGSYGSSTQDGVSIGSGAYGSVTTYSYTRGYYQFVSYDDPSITISSESSSSNNGSSTGYLDYVTGSTPGSMAYKTYTSGGAEIATIGGITTDNVYKFFIHPDNPLTDIKGTYGKVGDIMGNDNVVYPYRNVITGADGIPFTVIGHVFYWYVSEMAGTGGSSSMMITWRLFTIFFAKKESSTGYGQIETTRDTWIDNYVNNIIPTLPTGNTSYHGYKIVKSE